MKKEKSDQNAVAELTREWLYKENKWLWEENKKLREEIRFLEECLDRKEKVNKRLREELSAYDREYFDEDKKAKNIFMEEDTLQELRDLGKI